jgi:uncharacterized zinc-type alcohol dehydrogenase-like protein
MYNTSAYAATSATSGLAPTTIPRRDPGERDVQIEILFCGICHSDLHHVRDEFKSVMPTSYPYVLGHEIVGRVSAVGSAVTKHKPGDLVGVGCLVDSDRTCPHCRDGLEQFCPNMTTTMGSQDKHGTALQTNGGYSNSIVVDEHFVLRVASNLDLAGTAPLLCAGITTYSPMCCHGVTAGKKVGVVGLGGLGHMGVKFARAFGAHVVFTTSPDKKEDALQLSAHEVIVSRNADEMQKHFASFDFILDTVSAPHDINAYLNLLGRDSNLTLVGISEKPFEVLPPSVLYLRRSFSGSNFGGIAETQEMLDFCGEHNITADVEVIPIQKINEAYERLAQSDVKYRFSIDMASLKSDTAAE